MAKTNKDIFLARLQRERDKLELLINRVGFVRRMTLNGVVGKWSVKDILAHILAYEQFVADRMEEVLHGEPYVPCKTQTALDAFLEEFGYPDFGSPLLDDEAPSAWVVEKYRNVALEDVIAYELSAFATIVASLEKMTEETIQEHNIYERIANNTYKHYRDHIRDIKRWLALNAANSRNS
jgi:hypothetical protein